MSANKKQLCNKSQLCFTLFLLAIYNKKMMSFIEIFVELFSYYLQYFDDSYCHMYFSHDWLLSFSFLILL